MAKILVVDDQRSMRTTLSVMLGDAGHEVTEAADGEAAYEAVEHDTFDLVITDLQMGAVGGMEVLERVKNTAPLTEVIVMTAYGTVETAVRAMQIGAYDYIQKPFTEDELLVKVQKACEKRQLAGEINFLAAEFRDRYKFENIVGRSPAMRDVLGRIIRVASTDSTVLITGESGTGKELVAKAIHANSTRANRAFVSVNCAAITETLLESELFGHVRGAFTGATTSRKGIFEEAHGGTVFLDEVGETPTSFQAKLLRVLQEGELRRVGDSRPVSVDVRVIAATNQNLDSAIEEKRFREDLYYRLNVIRFTLPPLRDRREDIPLLADFFLKKYNGKMGRQVSFGEGVLEALLQYPFPGNVRELENLVERAVALAVGGTIQSDDVVPGGPVNVSTRPAERVHGAMQLQDVVDRAEREAIERVLEQVAGNKERAAEVLGLSSTTLWRKMKRLNVTWPRTPSIAVTESA